jgi:PAS domain-containing protein
MAVYENLVKLMEKQVNTQKSLLEIEGRKTSVLAKNDIEALTALKQAEDELRESCDLTRAQAEEMQSQSEEMQVQAEELEVQSEDLRIANDSLAETSARLRAVLEQMPVGVAIAEAPSGRIILSNAALEHILGRPPASR